MRLVIAYSVGVLFGLGIMISGMMDPAKVLNFFDIAGTWDPSLAFVMVGALAVTALGYRMVLRRPAPLAAARFQLPTKTDLNVRLIGGAAIFGIGWGIAGFCPGGALPALGTVQIEVFVFVGALVVGILAVKFIQSSGTSRVAGAANQGR